MLVYMTHPDHGTHIVYSPAEMKHCQKHGWKVYGDSPPLPKSMVEEKKKPAKANKDAN